MREIKFRAWDKGRKVMLQPAIPLFNNGVSWLVDGQYCFDALGIGGYEIMQYIGLKDIYQGDICKDEYGDIIEIVWSDHHQWGCKIVKGGALPQGLIFPLWHWDNCKENGNRSLTVIGNIYDNPDLLGGASGERN